MAWDWIKVELATPDKAEICGIATTLGIDIDAAFGKVFRVWAWFDQYTTDGNAPSVTKLLLDRIVCVTGFCNAMEKVGWMTDQSGMIFLPNFERHNGKTAKTRATTAQRVFGHRNKAPNCNDKVVTDLLQSCCQEQEQEQDIKEKDNIAQKPARQPKAITFSLSEIISHGVCEEVASDFILHRKNKKAPLTKTAWKGIVREIEKSGLSVEAGLSMVMERGWTGFKAEWANKPSSQKTPPISVKEQRARDLIYDITGEHFRPDNQGMGFDVPRDQGRGRNQFIEGEILSDPQ